MKFKINMWNKFCWVFLLPEEFNNNYCFNGGHATHSKGGSVRLVIIDAAEYVSDKDSIPEADADQNILDLGEGEED